MEGRGRGREGGREEREGGREGGRKGREEGGGREGGGREGGSTSFHTVARIILVLGKQLPFCLHWNIHISNVGSLPAKFANKMVTVCVQLSIMSVSLVVD